MIDCLKVIAKVLPEKIASRQAYTPSRHFPGNRRIPPDGLIRRPDRLDRRPGNRQQDHHRTDPLSIWRCTIAHHVCASRCTHRPIASASHRVLDGDQRRPRQTAAIGRLRTCAYIVITINTKAAARSGYSARIVPTSALRPCSGVYPRGSAPAKERSVSHGRHPYRGVL